MTSLIAAVAKLTVEIAALNQSVVKNSVAHRTLDIQKNEFLKILPLQSLEALKEFDKTLKNDQNNAVQSFVSLIYEFRIFNGIHYFTYNKMNVYACYCFR